MVWLGLLERIFLVNHWSFPETVFPRREGSSPLMLDLAVASWSSASAVFAVLLNILIVFFQVMFPPLHHRLQGGISTTSGARTCPRRSAHGQTLPVHDLPGAPSHFHEAEAWSCSKRNTLCSAALSHLSEWKRRGFSDAKLRKHMAYGLLHLEFKEENSMTICLFLRHERNAVRHFLGRSNTSPPEGDSRLPKPGRRRWEFYTGSDDERTQLGLCRGWQHV